MDPMGKENMVIFNKPKPSWQMLVENHVKSSKQTMGIDHEIFKLLIFMISILTGLGQLVRY